MNSAFQTVIAAGGDERRDLFASTAGRLGTAIQNVEKDFWVCWTLDALFNGLPKSGPRLLFKGGTSLSKAFGLISRFSEDIDITVFREDLGEPASVQDLEALSGKKQRIRLDAIKTSCQTYVAGPLKDGLTALIKEVFEAYGARFDGWRLEIDPDDPDRQSLLFWYAGVTAAEGDYVRSAVKIESGAKSALDPHRMATVKPYVADDVAGLDLSVTGVTTVEASRTFWDKIVILHGLRRWHDARGELRQGGQRVSRHYYDVVRLLDSPVAEAALGDSDLGRDCVSHALMFFNSRDLDLQHAAPGSFSLMPTKLMKEALQRDYRLMTGMVFGDLPSFDAVLDSISQLERRLNMPTAN